MPLDKAMRTVLFHKGIADGSDRFLLEPPSIDYAENLTLGKDGSFSKRQGNELIASAESTNPPLAIHEVQKNLVAIESDALRRYDGSSWHETPFAVPMLSRATLINADPVAGAYHADYCPLVAGGKAAGHAIAVEIREIAATDRITDPTETKVFLYGYDDDGVQTGSIVFDDCHSPSIVQMRDMLAAVYYRKAQGLRVTFFDPLTMSKGNEYDLGIDPSTQNLLHSHGDTVYEQFGVQVNRASGRIGESYDSEAKYQVAGDSQGIVVFWTDAPNNRVYLSTFTWGQTGGLSPAYIPAPSTFVYASLSSETSEVLDVALQSDGNIHVMFTTFRVNGTTPEQTQSTIYHRAYERNTTPLTAQQAVVTAGNRTYINGRICFGILGEVLLVYTDGGDSNWWLEDTDGLTFNQRAPRTATSALRWRTYNYLLDVLGAHEHVLYHHRLVSDVVFDGDGYRCVAQQWIDHTPLAWKDELSEIRDYVSILGALKPVTSVLVELKTSIVAPQTAYPMATLSAGESAAVDPSESMMSAHCVGMYDVSGSLISADRVIYEAPDVSMWIGNLDPLGSFRVGRSESQPKSGVRVHVISRSTDTNTVSLGDGIIFTSGLTSWTNGYSVSELGPLESPEIVRVDDLYWTQDGTKSVPIFFEVPKGITLKLRKMNVVTGFTDRHGNTHRSAPSATVYVGRVDTNQTSPNATVYPGSNVSVVFTAPLSTLGDGTSMFVELYVSDDDETDPVLVATKSFSRLSSSIGEYTIEAQLVRAQPSTLSGVLVGANRERTQQKRTSKPLYTSGGLAADPWPSFTKAVATSTRLFAIDPIYSGRVMVSKLFEDYIAPEYNPTLAINLGDERNLTAIGKLDDKVIVFEPDDVHVIYGDGPDNRGEGQEFAVHYVSTDVGCSDQKSIIETPAGLLFYSSPRGFYLLDRNLQIQFIGDAVEDIARGIRIKAATIDPANAEVRFLVEPDPDAMQTSRYGPDADTTVITRPPRPVFGNELPEDACLVFYYETGDWMLYTNYPGEAACIYQRRYTRILDDWSVWQESDGLYSDPTGTNRTLLRSPWIKLGETIQNYQRLWRISFLGRYLSSLQDLGGGVYEAGDIIVRLYFDYEALPSQERRERIQDLGFNIFDTTQARAERFQFEIEPKRGRCQAVKIEIEEVNSEDLGEGLTYGLGAGFEIVAADLFIGVDTQRALLPSRVKA